MTTLNLQAPQSALILMQYQALVLKRFADAAQLTARVARLLAAARAHAVTVIHIVVEFREGYPEVGEHNKICRAAKSLGLFKAGSDEASIDAAVAPDAGEIVLSKRRIGAFAGTELELLLRARAVDTLIVCGLTTGGAVLSTVVHAADRDYRVVVVRDCCADSAEGVHDLVAGKLLPQHADVLASDEVIAAFQAATRE